MARIIEGKQKNIIGSKLKELRIKKGLTQQQLSNKLETMAIYICRGSISRIEEKQRTVTDIELYGLSKILDVSIESLFEKRDI
ncbi:MAG: helix-turn-helix transcriptional regulator [Firmicutes bacterium]|jgi:transcriptional regulator with XRE-family HTH domain|nr:helix-turn-helix transcriptional regulator [Bacillota bacterium]